MILRNTIKMTLCLAVLAPAIGLASSTITSSTYTEVIRSNYSADRKVAMSEYRSLCSQAEQRFLKPAITNLVVSSICTKPTEVGGFNDYAFEGQLEVQLVHPITLIREDLSSGLLDTAANATLEWDQACKDWLAKYKNSIQRVLIQDCGIVAPIKLGVQPNGQGLWQASSQALRIIDVKTAYQTFRSCYCRQSETYKDYIDAKTGRPSRAYFSQFDMMYLNYNGFYENKATFDVYSKCVDEITKTLSCQEQ